MNNSGTILFLAIISQSICDSILPKGYVTMMWLFLQHVNGTGGEMVEMNNSILLKCTSFLEPFWFFNNDYNIDVVGNYSIIDYLLCHKHYKLLYGYKSVLCKYYYFLLLLFFYLFIQFGWKYYFSIFHFYQHENISKIQYKIKWWRITHYL